MTKLELQIHDDIVTTINKIKSINDTGIEIVIPQGSVLFENILNLKLVQNHLEKSGTSVHFMTDDPVGNNLISNLGDETPGIINQQEIPVEEPVVHKRLLPQIKIPKLNISIPRVGILIPLLAVVFVAVYVLFGLKAPRANAKIVVNSQPLTRSLTIRVKSGAETDSKNNILKGTSANSSVEDFQEEATTGEKTIGEKAKGEIYIYNKTTSDITLEEGEEVVYKGKSTDLSYFITEEVSIPASAPQDPADPASPIIPGEAIVSIEAEDIGETYNVDKDKSFEFDEYDKSDLEAKSKEDISGGKSELVKVVSEEDIKNLSDKLLENNRQQAEDSIGKSLQKDYKIIYGSTSLTITQETFSHKLGDETDKISLQQKINATGLVYNEGDLNKLLDDLVKELIPQGFVLSQEDREVKVEVLGNSTNSVLSSSEADVQVTLKTHVVPEINEETLKNELKGKTSSEAQKVLGSVKNVKSYEFSLSPGIPFFQKVPKDIQRIGIEIIHE